MIKGGNMENPIYFKSTQPKQYIWKPKEDITAYELALCVQLFVIKDSFSFGLLIENLPENAKRHFEEVKED
jgi:hypothetical protein